MVGCTRQSRAEAWRGGAEAAELCGAAELLGVPLTISQLLTTPYTTSPVPLMLITHTALLLTTVYAASPTPIQVT